MMTPTSYRYRTLLLLFVSLLVSACEKTKTNFELGIEQQVLHIANGDEPRELDPQLSTGSPESNIHRALSEGLVNRDPKTLEVIPGVAESWQMSDDGLSYTFALRKNARWSNGERLTAHDFVWSWHRALLPTLASEWAYMKFYIKNAEDFYNGDIDNFDRVGVTAVDDYTLKVELENPTDFFLQLLAHPSYYPVHKATVLAHGDMDQAISKWTLPENWVGNGPFALSYWAINDEIIVKKNPNYWDSENIRLNAIHFYPIEDQQAEVRAFRSGQVHLTYTPQLAIEKIQQYREQAPESLRVHATYASYYYEFNVTKKPFDNKLVRQAFALAIDRQLIVERVTKAGERPAYSIVPPDPEGYSPTQLFEYNPEKARTLLAKAGYPNGEGFPAVELLYNTQDNHRKVALAVQQMLKQNLGVDVSITNQEWKVYLNTKRNLQHQIARAGWIADYLDPSNFWEILYSKSGNNDTGWKNAAYDALLKKIKQTSDEHDKLKLYDELNTLFVDEMPVLPVYYYSDVNLVAPEVKGWHDNVMHRHTYNRVYLEASK